MRHPQRWKVVRYVDELHRHYATVACKGRSEEWIEYAKDEKCGRDWRRISLKI